jgi:hypothetical protein
VKLHRVVLYFRGHTQAIEFLGDIIDRKPGGMERARLLMPRFSGMDMPKRTKIFVLSFLILALAGVAMGLFFYGIG